MRDRIFLGVLGLGIFMTPPAVAQDDPAPEPPAEAPAPPPDPPPPEPPPEEPTTPPEEPPPPPPPTPPPAPPPKPTPPKAPPKKPSRAALPPAPEQPPTAKAPARQPRAAPAPTPRTTPRSTTAPSADPETEPKSNEEEADAKPKGDEEEDTDGLFGPFRIGGLVGVGLPAVLSFGPAIKLTRYFGAGLNFGLIPTIKLSLYGEAKIAYVESDLYGRIFPFGGMFFVGAGVGYATITGSFKSSYDVRPYQAIAPSLPDTLVVESKASVRTLVLTPQIGLQHTFGSGFTLGIDGGLQVPLAPSEIEFETQLPPEVPPEVIEKFVEPNDQKVRDTLEKIGRAIVPTLNLRVGWLF